MRREFDSRIDKLVFFISSAGSWLGFGMVKNGSLKNGRWRPCWLLSSRAWPYLLFGFVSCPWPETLVCETESDRLEVNRLAPGPRQASGSAEEED